MNIKKIKIPGKIFMKHLQFGLPQISGIYACYYKHNNSNEAIPPAGIKILHFNKDKFFGKDQVLAWIGPLPILSLDELQDNKECVSVVYYTGTLKQVINNKFKTGPHPQYINAVLQNNRKGDFIFEVNTHKSIPNPIAKFNIKINQFKKLKEKGIKKYIKIMKKYKEK